jgi:hypothetical protein
MRFSVTEVWTMIPCIQEDGYKPTVAFIFRVLLPEDGLICSSKMLVSMSQPTLTYTNVL